MIWYDKIWKDSKIEKCILLLVYTHTYVHTYIHLYMHACMHTYIHIDLHIHTHVEMKTRYIILMMQPGHYRVALNRKQCITTAKGLLLYPPGSSQRDRTE